MKGMILQDMDISKSPAQWLDVGDPENLAFFVLINDFLRSEIDFHA